MTSKRTRYRSPLEDSARWDGFAFRPDDIVLSAPSKCGMTWTQMICALLVFQTPELPAPLTTLSPWLDMCIRPIDEVCAQLEAQRHRRFIKTHTPLDGIPTEPGVRYLVVGRHPLDVAVSLHHQGTNLKREHIARLLGEDEVGYGLGLKHPEVRDTVLRWMSSDDPPQENLDTLRGLAWHLGGAWSRRNDPSIVLLHYGDLSRDLEGEMRRLADVLEIGVPEQKWPALVEAATFARMKGRADDLVPDERAGIFGDNSLFFRSGSTEQWRRWLTDDDVADYERRLGQLVPPDLADWLHHGSARRAPR